MIINRKSFWYALFTFPGVSASMNDECDNGRTLCSFFWRTVLNVVVWFGVVGVIAGCLLGYTGAAFVLHPIPMFIMFFMIFGISWFSDYMHERRRHKEQVAPQPGVFKSMWKSFKGKYCPLITFEN